MNVKRCTADTTVAAVASGSPPLKMHTVSIAPTTATPTAGLVTVYDGTSSSGTAVFSEWVFATTPGHTITLDCDMRAGIHVEYDGTLANASVTVTWQ
jgi:hypothetical protein